jgi:cytochrome P450 family 2 subfamily K
VKEGKDKLVKLLFLFLFECLGLAMTNGDQWRTMRRFALTTLRDLGMGKSRLQTRILEEIDSLIDNLRRKNESPCQPTYLMIACIANIMFAVTFDRRFDHEDPQFQIILDYLTIAVSTLSNVGMIQLFPWLRLIPGKFKKTWLTFTRYTKGLKDVFREALVIHERSHQSGQVRDYVGAFQDQRQKELKEGNFNTFFEGKFSFVFLRISFGATSSITASEFSY